MCTSDSEKCEILQPPAGCKPGDVVTVEGYERKPDPQLNPKKKIFETVQVDLKINNNKEATYKGHPWNVAGKGPALSSSLTNTIIKQINIDLVIYSAFVIKHRFTRIKNVHL